MGKLGPSPSTSPSDVCVCVRESEREILSETVQAHVSKLEIAQAMRHIPGSVQGSKDLRSPLCYKNWDHLIMEILFSESREERSVCLMHFTC